MTRESGYTIVEVLVAVMIFSIGLLAMAGTSSVILSTLTSTQSRTIAASVAESRFERVRATPCVGRAAGSAVSRGISEAWSLDRLARADDVTVNVTFVSSHRQRTETFRSFLPC
jgi:type II secretion system protein I